jgi:hypothetical protein
VAGGQLVRARDHVLSVEATEVLASGRVRLTRRGADQPPHPSDPGRVDLHDVFAHPLVAGGLGGRARPFIELDADRAMPKLAKAFIPTARAREQVDDRAGRSPDSSLLIAAHQLLPRVR